MLELTISSNELGEDKGKWTFGQYLAVFLLFSVAVDVANTCLLHLDRLLENKNPGEESSTDHTHIQAVVVDRREEALLPDVETTSAKGRSD